MNIPKSLWRQMLERTPSNTPAVEDEPLRPVAPPQVAQHGDAQEAVPWTLRVGAAWSWRLLVVTGAVYLAAYGLIAISAVTIPVLIGLLLTLILDPLNGFMRRRLGFGRGLAAGLSVLAGVVLIGAALGLAGSQIVASMSSLTARAKQGVQELLTWLSEGPLHVDQAQLEEYFNDFLKGFSSALSPTSTEGSDTANSSVLSFLDFGTLQNAANQAASITSSAVHIVTTLLIALFCLFFFLKDGRHIWVWVVRMVPVPAREPIHEAGIRGWMTLKGYIKAQVLVAAVDSISITLGAAILAWVLGAGETFGPLVLPLGLLIFLGCFIPIVGSLVTGAIAALVLLMDQGVWAAVAMVVIILVVNQVEGNILQPLFMSEAVSLHPLAVLLAVTAGTYQAGILGALFAVPVVAFINTAVLYLSGHDTMPELNTNINRPGGRPGLIHAMVEASYEEVSRDEMRQRERTESEENAALAAQQAANNAAAQQAAKNAAAQNAATQQATQQAAADPAAPEAPAAEGPAEPK